MDQLIYPDAHDWIGALQAGQQAGMTQRRNTAATTAGGFMASGDYKGAAAALYSGGDIAGGSAVAQAGFTQKTEADKLAVKAAVQQKIAANDLPGAYAAAGTDPDMLGALDKVTAHAKDTTAQMAAALQGLKDPQTGQWLPPETARPKYEAMKAGLISRGLPPDTINNFDPTPENLQGIQGQVLGVAQQLEMAKGVAIGPDLVNPYSGKEMHKGDQYKVVPMTDRLVKLGGDPSAPGSPAGGSGAATTGGPQMTQAEAPLPTGGVYDQVGQIATSKGASPNEVAYLQRLAQVESHGQPSAQNGKSTGVFQFHPDTFASLGGKDISSVDQQTAAALALQKRDRANLGQIGVEPTDANAYIMHQQGAGGGRALLTSPPETNAVAALTPVYGSAKIAQQAIVNNGGTPDMTAGQFTDMWRQRWANGGAPVAAGASGAAAQAAPAAALPSGAQVIMEGRPAWRSDNHGNLINDATGDRKLDPTSAAAGGMPTGDTSKTGDDYLKSLPTARGAQVNAMLTGRMAFPTSFALKTPYWQGMIADAAQVDPMFDATKFATRNAMRQAFTGKGKQAAAMTSIQTVIGHLDDYVNAVKQLPNTNFGWVNAMTNPAREAMGDTTTQNAIAKANDARTAVANELVSTLRGGVGAEADVKHWLDLLDVNQPTGKALAGASEIVHLIGGRLDPMRAQWQEAMGPSADPLIDLYPRAAKVYAKLGGDITVPDAGGSSSTRAAPAAPAAAPAAPAAAAGGLPPQAVAQLKPDHITTFANGQKWTLRGGQPARVQ